MWKLDVEDGLWDSRTRSSGRYGDIIEEMHEICTMEA
jgi:hypothetical protein